MSDKQPMLAFWSNSNIINHFLPTMDYDAHSRLLFANENDGNNNGDGDGDGDGDGGK